MKRKTGKWVFRGYHWHAYSYAIEQADCGGKALELLHSSPIEPYYLFRERPSQVFECVSEHWPDLLGFVDDLYLTPCSLKWMFVTTHEMGMGLGPYFAYPDVSRQA